jgi:hypothetical protein
MKRLIGLTTLGQSHLKAFLDEIAQRSTLLSAALRARAKSSSEISTVVFIWVPIPP